MATSSTGPILRAGIIGCGEIVQVSHIATLSALSDRFCITYLCDTSRQALEHCMRRVPGSTPKTTTRAQELCESAEVDVVLVCNASPLHVDHAMLALQYNKHVFVEKPLALCYQDIDALTEAEKASSGSVFVGYMRRYAPALQSAIREIGDSQIQYARVRDIIGPNEHFVAQSGTFPKRFSDYAQADADHLSARDLEVKYRALEDEFKVPRNPTTEAMLDLLGGLGTHDLSAMREVLGMPKRVLGARLTPKFWSAMLDYGDFTVVYESGINDVPVFDAHIEIYTDRKIIRVEYDTPYVKGLPTTLVVRERVGSELPAAYQERRVRSTYEDSYTIEFRTWYDCVVNGKQPKTTVQDARLDIDLIKMLMQAAYQ